MKNFVTFVYFQFVNVGVGGSNIQGLIKNAVGKSHAANSYGMLITYSFFAKVAASVRNIAG